jgi:cell division protein FtsQ
MLLRTAGSASASVTDTGSGERSNSLREQAITQKVGDRAGLGTKSRSGAMAQRPAKRGSRGEAGAGLIERLRSFAHYLPWISKIVLILVAGGLAFAGYRAAASASFFQLRQVDVRGTSRATTEQIQQVVRRSVGQTGVWRADLAAVSTQLEHVPWVRTAVVSRLLPDGVRVRITERVPRAVVRTAAGHFIWVDEDAVTLGEMSPSDPMPAFFLRGWNEESADVARLENRERVQKYLELNRDWSSAGLSERVSEVNLGDLSDVRAQLAGDDSQIEIRLGATDPGMRLKRALDVLDGLRQTPRGAFITCVDISQGKRAVVRFTSGMQMNTD